MPWKDNRGWVDHQWPQSPRRRQADQPSPRRRRGGKEPKGGSKGHGKRTGAGDHAGKGQPHRRHAATVPNPPPMPKLPKVPPPPNVTHPKSEAPQLAPADKGMDNLMAALLKSREELPQALRQMVDDQVAADTRSAAKAMHRLVANQAQAKRQLQEIQSKRQDYLHRWAKYIGELGTLWESQLQDKELFLDQLDAAEATWSRQLGVATKATAKAVASPGEEGECNDMEEDTEAEVAEAAALDVQRRTERQALQRTEQLILQQLKSAQDVVAQQVAEREASREASRSPRRRSGGCSKDVIEVSDDGGDGPPAGLPPQ